MKPLCWLSLIICSLWTSTAFAQTSSAIAISGQVLDSLETPLAGASVMLMHEKDSLLESFALVDAQGQFSLATSTPGNYLLQITYVGYGTFVRKISIIAGQDDLDFGRIVLRPAAYELADVTIMDSFIPILIKDDTIQYHADAFQTRPNATVEELLRKLPGIEVEQDGTIRAQGEEVENILVDGKEFFDDDPKVASRTIPAEIVDKVQLYDEASDFSAFTGIDDGESEKTINLTIKDGKNKGYFGTIEGSYGLDDRYKGSINLNRFTKQMQLSILGDANNLNEQSFSLQDYLTFTGAIEEMAEGGGGIELNDLPRNLFDNAGVSEIFSGGMNFNYDFNKKTTWRSSYFADYTDNITTGQSTLQNVLDNGAFITSTDSYEQQQLVNHRARFKLKHLFNENEDLTLRANLFWSDNDNTLQSNSSSVLTDLNSGNATERNNTSSLQNLNWQAQANYRKRLSNKGRFFTSSLRLRGQDREGAQQLFSNNDFFANDVIYKSELLRQQQDNLSDNLSLNASAQFVEPLGKARFLTLGARQILSQGDRQLDFFNTDDGVNYFFDETLSNQFTSAYIQSSGSASIGLNRKKLKIALGMDYQFTRLNNENRSLMSDFGKSFHHVLPSFRFSFNHSSSRSIQLNYNTRIQVPTLEQLQPTVDNRNPLIVTMGNADLQPEYIHEMRLNFNNFNQFYLRSFFTGFTLQYTANPIIYLTSVDADLRQVSAPVNSNGLWRLNGYYDWDRPIQNIDLKLRLRANASFQSGPFAINTLEDRAHTVNFSQTVQFENKYKDKLDIAVGYTGQWIGSAYRESRSLNQQLFNHRLFLNSSWLLGKSWTIVTDFFWDRYAADAFASDQQLTLLDLTVEKSFLDNKLTFYVKGVNLFDVDQDIQRNSFGNQIQEINRNRLGRLVLFGVSYKLRSFGK